MNPPRCAHHAVLNAQSGEQHVEHDEKEHDPEAAIAHTFHASLNPVSSPSRSRVMYIL